MAEENEDVEDEMLRMMEEELGAGGDDDGAEDKGEDDFESEMLAAMQDEAGDGGAGGGAEDDFEAEMLRAMMDETGASSSEEAQTALVTAQNLLPNTTIDAKNIHRLLGVSLSIIIELGRTETSIDNLLEWSEGTLIELDKVSGEAVDVYINGKPFAQGEVVTVAEKFGVRITELLPSSPPG
jgi:flagellar motor switch protein FliN/FliY